MRRVADHFRYHQSGFKNIGRATLVVAAILFVASVHASQVRAQSVISLTTCQNITTNGSYRLANNVSTSGTCFSIRGNVTNLTFDGNGKTITVGNGDSVEVADFGSGTPSNVTISNFTSNGGVRTYGNNINHITFQGLTLESINILGSDDVTIQNNTVGEGGIQINDSDTIGWNPMRPVVTNNTITGGSTNIKILFEIWGDNVDPCPILNANVTNNTITDTRNDPPPEATAAVRIRCARGTTFTNNTIRSTGTTIGLYLRDESDGGDYENNTFWVNQEEAIRMASGNNDKTFPAHNTFRNNLFRSDAASSNYFQGIGESNLFSYNVFWAHSDYIGGTMSAADDRQTHGNTYDHNTFYVEGSGNRSQYYNFGSQNNQDIFTNNIFSYNGGPYIYKFDGPFTAAKMSSNRNLFQNRGGSVMFDLGPVSLAGWRTATGNDLQSLEANPLFNNASIGDFTLQANSPARGAGSGGTDIGAKPYGSSPPPSCTENWSCGSFSGCTNGTQTRTCTDANACGTTVNRPALSQSCSSSCTESWSCGAFSSCVNNNQSRTCTDANACGTTVSRPALSQSCTSSCTENWSCSAFSACSNGTQSRTCTDSNACGTTTSRPALTQSCASSSQISCGTTCNSCVTNHIVSTACTTGRRICDGTNSVEDVAASVGSAAVGSTVTVTISYNCYNPADDNLALWYNNGASWALIHYWAPNSLTSCSHTVGHPDGTVSIPLTLTGNAGTHYIRAIEAAGTGAGDPKANSSSCPDLHWGNIDDLAITATTGTIDSVAPAAVTNLAAH